MHKSPVVFFLTLLMFYFLSCSNNEVSVKEEKDIKTTSNIKPSSPQNKPVKVIVEPENYFEYMGAFESVLGKVVFVKKDIFGGDLEYDCILKGKVRNITTEPIKEIFIIWNLWDENKELVQISPTSYYNPAPIFWADQIDFLDGKSEMDFSIAMLLGKMSPQDGEKIRDSVLNGRYEVCIFIAKQREI